jgi:hypothetical protein
MRRGEVVLERQFYGKRSSIGAIQGRRPGADINTEVL